MDSSSFSHSYLGATIGLTLAARWAGNQQASSAVASNSTLMLVNVNGSGS